MAALPEHDLTEAVLRPVRGHHAFEACVEQLAASIRLGVYPLGSTLPPERDLATRLNVSRATLREAMAALRQAGLVETTRGRGGGSVGLWALVLGGPVLGLLTARVGTGDAGVPMFAPKVNK